MPELGLTAGIMLMFLLDLAWKQHPRRVLFLTIGSLFFLGLAGVMLAMQPSAPRLLFNGMIASDPFATFFKWLFLAAAALTVLIAARSTEFGRNQNRRVLSLAALHRAGHVSHGQRRRIF